MTTTSRSFGEKLREKGIEVPTEHNIPIGHRVSENETVVTDVPLYTLNELLSKEFLEKVERRYKSTFITWRDIGLKILVEYWQGEFPAVESYILDLIS